MKQKREKWPGTLYVVLIIFCIVSFLNVMIMFQYSQHLPCPGPMLLAPPLPRVALQESLVRSPRTALAMGRKRSTSSHFCIQPRHFHPIYRSCHFTDVCFSPAWGDLPVPDGRTATLVYITDNNANITADELKTCTHRARYRLGPNIDKREDEFFLVPQVITSEASQSFHKIWSPVSIAIPFDQMYAHNFGHALGDNVLSFWRILTLFNLYADDTDFLPLQMTQLHAKLDCPGCLSSLNATLYPFLYNRGVSYMSQIRETDAVHYTSFLDFYYKQLILTNTTSPTLLCFENVISGLYLFSDHGEGTDAHGRDGSKLNPHLVSRGDTILQFRQAYMTRMNLDPDMDLKYHHSCDDHHSHLPGSIVMLVRGPGSKDRWWDVYKLIRDTSHYHDKAVAILGLNNTYGTMQDQVETVARTKVLVTMVGGASYISWFLPPGSTLILLHREDGNGSPDHFLESNIHSNLPHIHTRLMNYTDVLDEGEHVFDWKKIWSEIIDGVSRYDDVNRKCTNTNHQ